MKQLFLITFFVLYFYNSTLAQKSKRIRFGASVGVNASIVSKLREGAKPLIHPSLGISGDYRLDPRSSINTGVFYTRVGESNSAKGAVLPIKTKAYMDYLQLPVSVRVHDRKRLFYGQGGFQFGYVISNKLLANGSPITLPSNFNRIDFGLSIGAGLYIFKYMCIDIRYYHNLDDIGNSNNSSFSGSFNLGSVKHKILGLGISYYF